MFPEHDCPGNLHCLARQGLCEAVRNITLSRDLLEFDLSGLNVLSKLENTSVDVFGTLSKGLGRSSREYAGCVVLEDDGWLSL